MGKKVNTTAELAVVFACATCGKPIALTLTDDGAVIADVPAFLRTHARCLQHLLRDQRWIVLPD